jgi:NTP pyrophosphatase (non-canonical NTP hydrolase)
MVNGRKNQGSTPPLSTLFEAQSAFQKKVTGIDLPQDDVKWFQYHTNAMTEEMGELLKSDKRWKTHRNTNYDPMNKLEEIADVFITTMNIALFSGFCAADVSDAILKKILENVCKLRRNSDDSNS